MFKVKDVFNLKNGSEAEESSKRHGLSHDHQPFNGLCVKIDDLSEKELSAYKSWWKDLNPFGLDILNTEKALEFISSSGIPDETLDKILSFCQHKKEGLSQEEFFAVLRLISYAQKGYNISPALVYNKNSLPRFKTEAIEISLKPRSSCETSRSSSINSEYSDSQSSVGQNKHDTLTTPTARLNKLHPGYHHSRSRSLPFNPFTAPQSTSPFGTLGTPPVKSGQSRHGTHRSMDAQQLSQMVDTGQSLLLTQGFTPKFLNEPEEQASNPFDSTGSSPQTTAPTTPVYTNIIINTNHLSNKQRDPPPPVPPQSTKPNYPKYAHTFKR